MSHMTLRLGTPVLLGILFAAIMLKCLSPFLHAHVAGSSETGFHVSGMTFALALAASDDQDSNAETESYAVTVGDSRNNTFSIFIVLAIFLGALHMVRKLYLVDNPASREPDAIASYLSPNAPPPALAPPR